MLGNWFKTGLLMAAIMALFGTLGAVLGGGQGMLLALVLAAAMNLWAYWFSDTPRSGSLPAALPCRCRRST